MIGIFAFMYALEFGFQPVSIQPEYMVEDAFYTEVDLYITAFDTVFIGGSIKTDFVKSTGHMFAPFYTEYVFGAGVKLDAVTIGYEHMCQHGVDNALLNIETNGGYDRFYVQFGNM